MLMHYLAAIFKGLHIHTRVDDDFADKLNYDYTSAVIFAFAITVSAKQYVGAPIQCWVPAQFTDAWEQYTENYCWVENTWYLPLQHHTLIPEGYANRRSRQLSYYQWVPFVLAIEALMFYVPCVLWRGLVTWHCGMSVQSLASMACDARMMDSHERANTIECVAAHLQDSLEVQKEITTGSAHFGSSYCTYLYIAMKNLYVLNCVTQLFILNAFLGTENLFYGFHIMQQLLHGREWQTTGNFPRVTLCDFEVRVLGNVHHHTVQCVLMINMFNEKIFLFLWFWMIFVLIVSVLSTIHWIIIVAMPGQRVKFVRKYLKATDMVTDQQSVKRFVHDFLGQDGVFALRMISAHAGDVIATELSVALWHNFKPPIKRPDHERDHDRGNVTAANLRAWLMGQQKHTHNRSQFDNEI